MIPNYYVYAAKSNKNFTSQKGFFYIQISGDGKTTKRKIQVTLSSLDRTKEQTINFKDVSSGTSFPNNHNFKLLTTSSKSKKSSDIYYVIFVLKFSYSKTAHYMSKASYTNKVDTYRLNFNKYNNGDTGISTMNNTGHNIVKKDETLEMQINAANCGIGPVKDGYSVSNATANVNLSRGYYSKLEIDPNGGIFQGKTDVYVYGIKACESQMEIPNPERDGYVFIGWTLEKGKNCGGAQYDGTTRKFTFCGTSTSPTIIEDANSCTLRAEWFKNDGNLVLPEAGGKDMSLIFIVIGTAILIFLTKKNRHQLKNERRKINEKSF